MFGYVKPFKPELKINEYEIYQAVYCGLCRKLGKSVGFSARFSLSYDFVFLSLLSMALSDNSPEYKKCRCFANPFKKRNSCCGDCADLTLCADSSACATYYKLLDNVSDSTLLGRLFWWIPLLLSKPARNKALKRNPEVDNIFREASASQQEFEKLKIYDSDHAAEPFAHALSRLFSLLSKDPTEIRVLDRLGYLFGRYVYIIDALDDIEKDSKKHNYNPFLPLADDIDAAIDKIHASLFLTISEIERTFALLDVQRYRSILENIISLGLQNEVRAVTHKKENKR